MLNRTCWIRIVTRWLFTLLMVLPRFIGSSLAIEDRGTGGPQMISIRKGGDALLRCDVPRSNGQEPPPYVIEWFRQGISVPVFIKAGKHPPHINEYYEGRMFITDDSTTNASLLITNVTESDDGWYECRILFFRERFEKSSNGTWVKLEITGNFYFIKCGDKCGHPQKEIISSESIALILVAILSLSCMHA